DRKRRVAAGEDQAQAVILDPALVVLVFFVFAHRLADLLQLVLADARAPEAVEGSVACGHLQPAAGVCRDAVAPPALQRPRERILGALLGEVPVARDADQVRDHPPPFGAEGVADRLLGAHPTQTGLTSTVPNSLAGFRAANSSASSRSSHSST